MLKRKNIVNQKEAQQRKKKKTCLMLMVVTLKNHVYQFKNQVRVRKNDDSIGLKLKGEVADCIMVEWDTNLRGAKSLYDTLLFIPFWKSSENSNVLLTYNDNFWVKKLTRFVSFLDQALMFSVMMWPRNWYILSICCALHILGQKRKNSSKQYFSHSSKFWTICVSL